MMKIGRMQTYEALMENAPKADADNVKDELIKLLFKCQQGYDSIERLRVIFKMQRRHEKHLDIIGLANEAPKNDDSLSQG